MDLLLFRRRQGMRIRMGIDEIVQQPHSTLHNYIRLDEFEKNEVTWDSPPPYHNIM